MILNNQNYHSTEANQHYWSNSQYKEFLECEARGMAKLRGWAEPPSEALLVGSYVHAYFESKEVFEQFKSENPEIIASKGANKGNLKKEFQRADELIRTIENDPLCMFVLQGQKEVILTAEFAGAKWKVKMDNYAPDRNRFSDIKTVREIQKETWDPNNGYVTFVEASGYVTQMALYAEIERRVQGRDGWIEPIIVAVSKEDPPDKAVISINGYDIQRELDLIEMNMPRLIEVKSGRIEPDRCENCRYCRETKTLNKIVHYTELINQ
ncbi:PD-(D/E)XK nuclease-like domain-containing protein [Paenibacillus bouchesdurhonensis]|uniref:PD-(D/E)XK nuclease-like domain-containing protein n=1 Tax=Paenibacillus bouchesdurhonensis TaxID=1870990 RepID=UPI000DA634BA|nr:PD-(D/E)XK nuclease-like domain-containing protein [Paenibacillus bouchesdurhonensis]